MLIDPISMNPDKANRIETGMLENL